MHYDILSNSQVTLINITQHEDNTLDAGFCCVMNGIQNPFIDIDGLKIELPQEALGLEHPGIKYNVSLRMA